MPPVVAAVSAVVAKLTWVAVGKFILKTALMAGVSKLLVKKPNYNSGISQNRLVMIRSATAPRQIIYGQAKSSGVLLFAHTSGASNEFMHLIVAIAGHEVEELGDVYFGEELIPLDGSGNATGKYAGHVLVQKHLGTAGQTVNTTLNAALPSVWTSDHRLRGVAYLYVRLKFNQDLFSGEVPDVSVIVKGRKVYDPRSGLTQWSANAALCQRDYMTNTEFGLGIPSGEIDSTTFNNAANVCDESVALNGGGTEARYTCNGIFDMSLSPEDALGALLTASAGSAVYSGGLWFISAGAYDTPTVTINEDDLRGPISVQTKPSRRDTVNGVKGTYITSKNNYQPSDFPPVVDSTYLSQDGGERLWQEVELPFTNSSAMAQRLARIQLERARRGKVVRMPCKLTVFQLRGGRNVMVNNTRFGWTNKVFEIVDLAVVTDTAGEGGDPSPGVDLLLREVDSGIWSWSSTQETQVDIAPGVTIHDPSTIATPSGLALSTSNLLQLDGTITPRIQVQWSAPANQFIISGGMVLIEYKKTSESLFVGAASVGGGKTEHFIPGVHAGVSYDVRIAFMNAYGTVSAYSSVATMTVSGDVTAPAAPTGLAATAGPGCIVLDWNDNTEADLDRYIVERSANGSTGWTKIWEGYASQHVDFDVTAGVTWYYRIKAADATDNISSASSNASAAASSTTGPAGGYTDYIFKRNASQPSTPTGDTPAGWSDAPPAGSDPLWMSVGDKNSSGVLQGSWSTPIRLDGPAGANGSNGSSVEIEYSVNGSTSWHSTFTTGDIYMRQRVGAGSWSAAIRIVGEQGPAPSQVADPTASFAGSPNRCTLSCATSGATIWYQYNSGQITQYTGTFNVAPDAPISFWATKAGMLDSNVVEDSHPGGL